MARADDILRALSTMVRVGRVSSVDADKHAVRVLFDDADGLVSYDLAMVATRPDDYSLPAKDTAVLCLMLPGPSGLGFVLGCIYTDADAPPLSAAGARSVAGDDVRLGDPEAEDAVALAPAVKEELDSIKSELDNVKLALGLHTHLAGTLVSPAGAVTGATAPSVDHGYTVSYSPTEPAAEKVKAA